MLDHKRVHLLDVVMALLAALCNGSIVKGCYKIRVIIYRLPEGVLVGVEVGGILLPVNLH